MPNQVTTVSGLCQAWRRAIIALLRREPAEYQCATAVWCQDFLASIRMEAAQLAMSQREGKGKPLTWWSYMILENRMDVLLRVRTVWTSPCVCVRVFCIYVPGTGGARVCICDVVCVVLCQVLVLKTPRHHTHMKFNYSTSRCATPASETRQTRGWPLKTHALIGGPSTATFFFLRVQWEGAISAGRLILVVLNSRMYQSTQEWVSHTAVWQVEQVHKRHRALGSIRVHHGGLYGYIAIDSSKHAHTHTHTPESFTNSSFCPLAMWIGLLDATSTRIQMGVDPDLRIDNYTHWRDQLGRGPSGVIARPDAQLPHCLIACMHIIFGVATDMNCSSAG